ncbi:ABC-2 type transport system permease protein [Tamaricihabitans halophyticus]|uniref:ABC-2 type transport system permease protein n=1 Tax=Tamaricihabitans halophyticus TaxID=1262583 RepID=A0A4V2SV50_9PSEU|nr:ABC transporter permease [Tamaricihabitans halophyticus]TCP56956.1 ABC-2 type transport system permease protein [Tamaricihabitans halophyticus]
MSRAGLLGTGQLVRLALRRDRVSLPCWIVVLSVLPPMMGSTYTELYPSVAERAALTDTLGANPSIALLYGPAFDLSSPGGFVAWRIGGFGAVLIALFAIFTVTRHTRAEEDSGRAELLGSTVLGRYAMLTAALIVAGGASLLIGVLQALGLIGIGEPVAGSLALGFGMASAGLVFAGLAAISVQLATYARSANSLAATVVAVAFVLRGVGDATADVPWLSWLSPIGWTQQLRPFAGERWWVFALPVGCAVLFGLIGYLLLPRRDLAAGLLPERAGPARAGGALTGSLGLAWRLQRGSLIGWLVAMMLGGAIMGALADGIGQLLGDSPQVRQIMRQLGGQQAMVDAFLATVAGVFGLLAAMYGVQAALRMRAEEATLRLEPLLATKLSRLRWAAGHLVFAFFGTAVVLLAAGFAMGLAHGFRSADIGGGLTDVLAGSLVQLPASWLLVGLAVVLFGALPHFATAAWGLVAVAILLSLFGPVLRLPQLIVDASPFTHVPKLPGAEITATPLVWLTALVALALGVGLTAFRRRDLA